MCCEQSLRFYVALAKNRSFLRRSSQLITRRGTENKKLSYRRGIARCFVSIEILPIATQQCRNYLYDKSWPNRCYEVGGLVGGNVVRNGGSTVLTVRVRYIIKAPLIWMGLSTYVCVRKDHNSQLIKSNSVNIELRQHIQLINIREKQRYTFQFNIQTNK